MNEPDGIFMYSISCSEKPFDRNRVEPFGVVWVGDKCGNTAQTGESEQNCVQGPVVWTGTTDGGGVSKYVSLPADGYPADFPKEEFTQSQLTPGGIFTGEVTFPPSDECRMFVIEFHYNTEVEEVSDTIWEMMLECPSNLVCDFIPAPETITTCNGTGAEVDPCGWGNILWTKPSGQKVRGPQVNVTESGIYNLRMTSINRVCAIDTNFEMKPEPNYIFEPKILSKCFGDNLRLESPTLLGKNTVYEWTGPNGFKSTRKNPVIPNAEEIHEGVYSVTAKLPGVCEKTAEVEVDLSKISVQLEAEEITCFDGTTELNALIEANFEVSSIFWQPTPSPGSPANEPSRTIGAGTYAVEVVDVYGCKASDQITIVNPSPVEAVMSVVEKISCNLEADGVIGTVVSGGAAPYVVRYLDAGPSQTILNEPGQVISSHLYSDFYRVTVEDANGCLVEQTLFLDEPGPIEPTVSVTQNCDGTADIEIATTGGTPPYQYEWNTGDPDSPIIVVDQPGDYEVIVRDTNSCWGGRHDASINDEDFIRPKLVTKWGECGQVDIFQLGQNQSQPDIDQKPIDTIDRPTSRVFEYEYKGCPISINTPAGKPKKSVGFPTAFSPNGDENNPVFRAYASEKANVKIHQLYVFDRWGNQVFGGESESGFAIDEIVWDGTIENHPDASMGNYTYVASYTCNGIQRKSSGGFLLFR